MKKAPLNRTGNAFIQKSSAKNKTPTLIGVLFVGAGEETIPKKEALDLTAIQIRRLEGLINAEAGAVVPFPKKENAQENSHLGSGPLPIKSQIDGRRSMLTMESMARLCELI